MLRYLFMALSLGISAYTLPQFLTRNDDIVRDAAVIARDQVAALAARQTASAEGTDPGPTVTGTERLRADGRGHFIATIELNGRRIEGMIDTGATALAINQSMARRAGLQITDSDYAYRVNTANGQARAARARIDLVELGSIRVRDVDVLVLEDAALDMALIGMTFLNRLDRFEQRNGVLTLRQ